jgi:hypothetical protein
MMLLQIVGAAVTASTRVSCHAVVLHSKKQTSSILDLLFEKTEEETGKTEEEKDRMARVVLIDFSQIALSLSSYHTPQVELSVLPCPSDVRPPVHELNCVLLI